MPNAIHTRRGTERSLIRAYTDMEEGVKTLGRAKDQAVRVVGRATVEWQVAVETGGL